MSYSRTARPTTRTVRPSVRPAVPPSAGGAGRTSRNSQYGGRLSMQDHSTTPYQQRPGLRAPISSTPRRLDNDLEGDQGNPAVEGAGSSGAMGQERAMQRLLNNYLNLQYKRATRNIVAN